MIARRSSVIPAISAVGSVEGIDRAAMADLVLGIVFGGIDRIDHAVAPGERRDLIRRAAQGIHLRCKKLGILCKDRQGVAVGIDGDKEHPDLIGLIAQIAQHLRDIGQRQRADIGAKRIAEIEQGGLAEIISLAHRAPVARPCGAEFQRRGSAGNVAALMPLGAFAAREAGQKPGAGERQQVTTAEISWAQWHGYCSPERPRQGRLQTSPE
ncbi:MAG: hypothetical protein P8X76_03425 [Maritimibacter sp.]